MGLGSQNNGARKEFRTIAGKSDWKGTVKTIADAQMLIDRLKDNLSKDPNGNLILATYAGKKINLLESYIKSGTPLSLKDFEKT